MPWGPVYTEKKHKHNIHAQKLNLIVPVVTCLHGHSRKFQHRDQFHVYSQGRPSIVEVGQECQG